MSDLSERLNEMSDFCFVCEVEVFSKALDLLSRRLGLLQRLEMLVAQQTYDHPKS